MIYKCSKCKNDLILAKCRGNWPSLYICPVCQWIFRETSMGVLNPGRKMSQKEKQRYADRIRRGLSTIVNPLGIQSGSVTEAKKQHARWIAVGTAKDPGDIWNYVKDKKIFL